MSLQLLHGNLSKGIVFYMAIIGLWGLVLYFRKRGVTSDYWGILAIGEILMIAQAVLGVAMVLTGASPARVIHFLYGLLGIICIPGVFAYTRGEDGRREVLIYALIGLFLMGVSIRAITTATGG